MPAVMPPSVCNNKLDCIVFRFIGPCKIPFFHIIMINIIIHIIVYTVILYKSHDNYESASFYNVNKDILLWCVFLCHGISKLYSMEIHVHSTLAKIKEERRFPTQTNKGTHTYMYITHKKLKIENSIEK